jgi:O-antigen/teichoic acid export membrane protein
MTGSEPSLRHNFSWTLLGNVTYVACLWGILASLTKLGEPETVGRFSLGAAIANPVIMFSNLQLRAILATDVADTHEFRDYLGLRLVMLPSAFVVMALLAVIFYQPQQALVIGLVGLVRTVEALSDLAYGIAQKYERMDLMAKSLILRGIGALVLFFLLFWWTRELALGILGMALGLALPLLLFDLPRFGAVLKKTAGQSLRPRFVPGTMKEIVWLALPMGLVMLLIQLRVTIPRTFLEHHFGEGDLGIFAALSYLVIAGMTVATALGQSSLARLSRYYASRDLRKFRRTVFKLVTLGIGLGLAGVAVAALVGRPMLTLLYSEEYAAHSRLFILIMAVGGVQFVVTLLGAPATAMRAFRGQLVIFFINVLVILVLSMVLIPRYGMTGAALSLLGGGLWSALGFGMLVRWKLRRAGEDTLAANRLVT